MTESTGAAGTHGFIIKKGEQFVVDHYKVSPESVLATSRLLQEICRYRHLAGGEMLDIGCGTKPYAIVFENLVTSHTGVDVPYSAHSHSAIDVFSTATILPFRDASFDFVLCTEVLEHVSDPFSAYSEISRVLKPGGRALITTPFMYRVHEEPYDFFRYTRFGHASMAERAGLVVESVAERGGYLTVAADYMLKGIMLFYSGLGIVLYKITGHGRGLARSRPFRAVFSLYQKGLFFLLKNERVKSDVYTLGYVVVAVKR